MLGGRRRRAPRGAAFPWRQPGPAGERDRRERGVDAELAQDILRVGAHAVLGQHQIGGDLRSAESCDHARQDVALAAGQGEDPSLVGGRDSEVCR